MGMVEQHFVCYLASSCGLFMYLLWSVLTSHSQDTLSSRVILNGSLEGILVCIRWYNECYYNKIALGDHLHHAFVVISFLIQCVAKQSGHHAHPVHGWLMVHLNCLHVPCGLWYLGCRHGTSSGSNIYTGLDTSGKRTVERILSPLIWAHSLIDPPEKVQDDTKKIMETKDDSKASSVHTVRGRGPSIIVRHASESQTASNSQLTGVSSVSPDQPVIRLCKALFVPTWVLSTSYRTTILFWALYTEYTHIERSMSLLLFATMLFLTLQYLDAAWGKYFFSNLHANPAVYSSTASDVRNTSPETLSIVKYMIYSISGIYFGYCSTSFGIDYTSSNDLVESAWVIMGVCVSLAVLYFYNVIYYSNNNVNSKKA